MPTSVRWDGVPQFDAEVLARIERARDAAHDFVAQGAHAVEGNIKTRAGEGGRHKRGTPTPARKGGGPAVVSGGLRRGVRVDAIRPSGLLGFETKVGPTSVYGRRVELEFGYPYVRPGLADTIPRLARLQVELWRKALA